MTDEQPELTAWEDRCRGCDDTGVTIQTERRCACQPPMQAEQPSQWAVDMLNDILSIWGPLGDNAAALTIQRAFAEREAELVGALKLARNRLQMCAVDAVASGNPRAYEWSEWADQTTAALKSREAGHG